MANTEILKALQLIRDAKKAVNEALFSCPQDKKKFLERLEICLEELEEKFISSLLEEKINELKQDKKQLESTNLAIKKKMSNLKSVTEKVDTVAKAIGLIIDIIGKAATLAGL